MTSTTLEQRPAPVLPYLVTIGLLVGGNFALAKLVVLGGLSPIDLFAWQVLGSGLILTACLVFRRRTDLKVLTSRSVATYCAVNGLIGVTFPQILSYYALTEVPAGLFAMLIPLSPLLTFCFSCLAHRKFLPLRRLLGILIGLAGVTVATADKVTGADISLVLIAAAFLVPVLLAITNVYRERAMPAGANPLVLAAGTLLSQATVFLPLIVLNSSGVGSVPPLDSTGLPVLVLCAVTALSYVITFELYRRTDGVGFSQVGYFATLAGIAAGTVFFAEPVTPWFAASVILLFVGMAVSDGHLRLRHLLSGRLPAKRRNSATKGELT
ncbi:DMT family transporter [Roseibium sp.]|uniref:DMT family transporter n=1 Tax=Roseibium sp. TaxID=1936156 RepID=UPI003D135D9F